MSTVSLPSPGSLSTTLSLTTTTSHAARMNAPCTSLMSGAGGAATTASSRRSESSPTGHGRLTSTSTSRTGVPRLSRTTGRWRGRSRRRPRCPKRRDRRWADEKKYFRDSSKKDWGSGTFVQRATGPRPERRKHEVGKKNSYQMKTECRSSSCSGHFSSSATASAAVGSVSWGDPVQSCTSLI